MIMRHELEKILRDDLRFLAIETRDRLKLTQREMGNRLHMSESAYSDIETGKYMCSTLTTVLLLDMQEDPKRFLNKAVDRFAEWYKKEMQLL